LDSSLAWAGWIPHWPGGLLFISPTVTVSEEEGLKTTMGCRETVSLHIDLVRQWIALIHHWRFTLPWKTYLCWVECCRSQPLPPQALSLKHSPALAGIQLRYLRRSVSCSSLSSCVRW